MKFLLKFIAKVVLNGLAFYVAQNYVSGFVVTGGVEVLIVGALVLAILNTFLRPILKIISAPLLWVTFGLFNIVLNMFILWLADQVLTQIAITNLGTLFWVSIIVALANTFL